MLTAVVAHSPRFGGKVRSFDASAALAVQGVQAVFEIDSGVAVVARDYWTASKGREALTIEWDDSNAEMRGSKELREQYASLLETSGTVAEQEGNADAILAAAGDYLEASFEFPYLSHAPMEPMNCVAQINGNSAELWYGCQFQTIDQMVVAEMIGGRPEDVVIHTLFAGGGFGRRANPFSDYIVETVNIARQHPGVPVKLVWSREDDIRGGFYRPAFMHKLTAALGPDGKPQAFKARLAGQSIMEGTPLAEMSVVEGVDVSSVEGLVELAYHVPHRLVELHSPKVGVPVQWWRSVGNTHTAFSKEVFIDLLARKAGVDPVDYRLALLQHNPKETAVLKLAAEKAGWGRAVPANTGRGVAVHSSFGSSVAEIVDVSVSGERFKVDRVVAVIDCGTVVNPDIVRAQVEGAVALGLSAALGDELTLTDGLVDQSNFHDYQVLRMGEMPEVEVYFIDSDLPPTGVGEPGTPPIAPAVANALAAATGKTYTRLPLKSV
jgi:isoquinoline 1-oxidoreductase beta subunit